MYTMLDLTILNSIGLCVTRTTTITFDTQYRTVELEEIIFCNTCQENNSCTMQACPIGAIYLTKPVYVVFPSLRSPLVVTLDLSRTLRTNLRSQPSFGKPVFCGAEISPPCRVFGFVAPGG